jgi:hypothetical protein
MNNIQWWVLSIIYSSKESWLVQVLVIIDDICNNFTLFLLAWQSLVLSCYPKIKAWSIHCLFQSYVYIYIFDCDRLVFHHQIRSMKIEESPTRDILVLEKNNGGVVVKGFA